jgi:lipid A disaccharide synthetase
VKHLESAELKVKHLESLGETPRVLKVKHLELPYINVVKENFKEIFKESGDPPPLCNSSNREPDTAKNPQNLKNLRKLKQKLERKPEPSAKADVRDENQKNKKNPASGKRNDGGKRQ